MSQYDYQNLFDTENQWDFQWIANENQFGPTINRKLRQKDVTSKLSPWSCIIITVKIIVPKGKPEHHEENSSLLLECRHRVIEIARSREENWRSVSPVRTMTEGVLENSHPSLCSESHECSEMVTTDRHPTESLLRGLKLFRAHLYLCLLC